MVESVRVAPLRLKLADAASDQVRRNTDERLAALEALPIVNSRLVAGVQLADGVTTAIAHGLGKPPALIVPGVPRGATSAGYIVEVRDAQHNRAAVVQLVAHGYGATITIDLLVAG